MAWDGALVRFGEVGIKSPPVRKRMVERLRANLEAAMVAHGVEGAALSGGSRLWLRGTDGESLAGVACRVFGVVSASPARQVEAEPQAIAAAAAELALERTWSSFAVRARREGTHGFTSQALAVAVGSAVQAAAREAARPDRVDLSRPDLELHVDVRAHRAFLFCDILPGPGGLPMGSQGKVLALARGPASWLAAWLMMRRGCRVMVAHAEDSKDVKEGLDRLRAWGLDTAPIPLPSLDLDAAAALARQKGCVALVTGDGLGAAWGTTDVPVLRPLAGLDHDEQERWRNTAGLPALEPAGAAQAATRRQPANTGTRPSGGKPA